MGLLKALVLFLRIWFVTRVHLTVEIPGSPPTTGGDGGEVQQTPQATSTRPSVLGLADASLAALEVGPHHRQTGHGDPLASPGVSSLLALEVQDTWTRAPIDRTGGPGFDPKDVEGEPNLGCTSHSIRAQAAWTRRGRKHGCQIHGSSSQAPFADMAHLPG